MKKQYILILFFLIVLSSLVTAQPPFQQVTGIDKGLVITYPQYDTLRINTPFSLHTHVINESDGNLMTNLTTSCLFHLYNSTGDHVLQDDLIFDSNSIDFVYNIAASNFSQIGTNAFIIYCNASNIGGTLSASFEVTLSGIERITNRTGSIPITIFLLSIVGVFLLLGLNNYQFTKHNINNMILKRSCIIISLFLMVLTSAIMSHIATLSGYDINTELFAFMEYFGWGGYVAIIYLMVRTLFDYLNLMKEKKYKDRYGDE